MTKKKNLVPRERPRSAKSSGCAGLSAFAEYWRGFPNDGARPQENAEIG